MEGTTISEQDKHKHLASIGLEINSESEMVNEMISELNTPVKQDKNSHLIVGEEYKITGGKYKKWKQCRLEKINDTYSDVSVQVPHQGLPTTTETCKVKNTYLLRLNPPAVNMPDADDLVVVEDLETHFENNPSAQFAPVGGGKKEMINNIIESINDMEVPCQDCYKMRYDLLLLEHKELKENVKLIMKVIKTIASVSNIELEN